MNFEQTFHQLGVTKIIGNWDFSAISSNTLTFLSGDGVGTVRCFTVEIYNDTSIENDEFFTLSLRNGRDAVATGSSARINILDNDGKNKNVNVE